MEMRNSKKNVLLMAMPFAGTAIPSIQLPILEGYLKERNVDVSTKHLYLNAAEIYGLNNYNCLISSPNDPYNAQMFFSKFVFPQYWNETKENFKKFFNEKIKNNEISFEEYQQLTDIFYNWTLENVDWESYDIIGFTLNYGQFLPSLAIAKKIKELDSEKKIILGGSRTINQIGINVFKTFEYIDFIVSGEGEEALHLLASDFEDYKSIPNLIYRDDKEIKWNRSDDFIDLDTLPFFSYDQFYQDLSNTSEEIQQYYSLFGRLPIEISRGCWWNKCSFCNLNLQHKNYREKSVEKIVEEIAFLSDKYNMLNFQIIGNALLKTQYRPLCEKLIELGRDFSFFAEARAGRLKSDDYTLLKKAGFITIQTGIETFSQNYLSKMNKGTRVIDNIASLKFCKENGISNSYNMIINYPNEEKIDFEESKKNIQLIWRYLDPPTISYLTVGFGSTIYNNLEQFNIEKIQPNSSDKLLFPDELVDKNINYFYGYKRKEKIQENNWGKIVEYWKKDREGLEKQAVKTKKIIDKIIFYFKDGSNFIKIYDKRYSENVVIYVLNELERKIFLSCIDVISYQKLQQKFSNIEEFQLNEILTSFEQNAIIFREDDLYLSLPLRYNKVFRKTVKEISEQSMSVPQNA
jgi:ribosomal peptide maturation radical SAM protein 1